MVNALNKPTFPLLLNEYVVVAVPYYKWQKIRVKRALGGGKNQMGEQVETLFTFLLLFSVVIRSCCIILSIIQEYANQIFFQES